jgi:hypothetical protein
MEFKEFQKIPRLSRDVVITEKIDGTNASIYIGENGEFLTGSRTRWITPENDNAGFARWANEHKEELMTLGIGHHFGEWWGCGIQRNYGLKEKRFSLFNVGIWIKDKAIALAGKQQYCPDCCHVVPILETYTFDSVRINEVLEYLQTHGSLASPGFMNPEGIVLYHTAAQCYFKKTIEKDDIPKGLCK